VRKQCPTGATKQREDGIVVIDKEKCMGCQYCVVTCPYSVRYYLDEVKPYVKGAETPYEKRGKKRHKKGAVEKCDFCLKRVEQGLKPACVTSCIANARHFGDLNDPNSEVSKLIARRRAIRSTPNWGQSRRYTICLIIREWKGEGGGWLVHSKFIPIQTQ